MKKITLAILTSFTLIGLIRTPVKAETGGTKEPTAVESARASVLLDRLAEIKDMKLESLTVKEKKGLRNEVKSIRSELKEISGGIYLSVGALIVILILLLLLL